MTDELNFVCVGPQRTATSWLDRLLRQHSNIALPEVVKETFFFDRDYVRGWAWYWNTYFESGSHIARDVVGEISPTLFDQPYVIDRIRSQCSSCRIVICLRDPIARSLSLFEHYVVTATVPNDWEIACKAKPSIIEASLYRKHIDRWVGAFGAANVLLVSNRAVSEQPQAVLNALCDFLGISRMSDLPSEAREPYGVAARPRSRVLAALSIRFARGSRRLGLHALANWGKRMGLKRLLFAGGQRPELSITPADKESLDRLLEPEVEIVAAVDAKVACTVETLVIPALVG